MTMWQARLVAVSFALGVILLPGASHAQNVGVATPVPPVAEQQWASVRCGACQRAGITFEFRQLPNVARDVNGFTIARVRNLTQREVTGTIEVMEDDLPDSDFEGTHRWQTVWFALSPSGNEKGEQVVLLRQSTPVQAIVHDVAQW